MTKLVPIFAFFAAGVALGQQQSGQTGRIAGQVSSSAGGPVRKATVNLRTVNPQGAVNTQGGGRTLNSADTTDEQGRFLFEELPAGTYMITVQRQGFLAQAYGARPGSNSGGSVTLASGEDKRGVQITMVPQSVISGRITDQDGDPVTTPVVAMRVNYLRGRRTLTPAGTATSDDQGNYRLTRLSSGKYYIAAGDARGNAQDRNNVRPARKGAEVANLMTYYPGVVESAAAAPVQIAPGVDMQGIDIRMRRSNVFDIRGNITGVGADSGKVNLTLVAKDGAAFGQSRQVQAQPNGTFELRRVAPGDYVLQAASGGNRPNGNDPRTQVRGAVARLDLRVGDSNIEGVRLELRPTGEVLGSIKFEPASNAVQGFPQPTPAALPNGPAGAPGSGGRNFNVTLTDVESVSPSAVAARPKEDGSLQFMNVRPGKYAVAVGGLPQGSYVKSIRLGGQDVTYTPIDFTGGANGFIEIVVSGNGAGVTGTIRSSKGDAIPYAMVTIWPKDRNARPLGNGIVTVNADASGTFRFSGLAPGEYLIAAWEEVEQGFTQSPDFLVRFDREATSVTVREGSRETVEAKLVPRDAILVAVSAIQ